MLKEVSVKPEKTSCNFWNISEIFHEIFQGKKFMKFYITMYNSGIRGVPYTVIRSEVKFSCMYTGDQLL